MQTRTKYLIVLLLGFLAGIGFEYWFLTAVWPNRNLAYTWIFAMRDSKKIGEPCKTDIVLNRKGYSLGYSYQYKSALWASYILSTGSVSVDVGRSGNFYADADIPEQYRIKLDDYANTGYDKGHLAPSASIDFSKDANKETFALSNIVPQEPNLNRQAWGKLENLERDWTKTKGKLYVITGPIYSSRPKKVNNMLLPSEFYKVIYSEDAKKAIGFIFPNKAVSGGAVWNYAMSVQDVEKETGLKFFSTFDEKTQQQLKETADIEWWQKS